MKRIAAILTAALGMASAQPASAIDLGFGLFKKKPAPSANAPKSDASLKTKQLVATLQADPDVDRRKVAAETLRTHDPRNNTDVIPTLVHSLQNDPNAGVRAIAAESLGSIKSVYPNAGAALESSEKSDPDANVRAVAKAALWQYHLNGYKTPTTVSSNLPSPTGEPPLAAPRKPFVPTTPTPVASDVNFRPITQGMGKGPPLSPTSEPPLAKKAPPVTVPDAKPPIAEVPSIPVPMPMPEPDRLPMAVPPVTVPDVPMVPTVPSGTPTVQPPKR